MNIDNVNKAIAVMERVRDQHRAFNMWTWQEFEEDDTSEALNFEAGLVNCGTAACFAGWVAVSDEFKQDGGNTCPIDGCPTFPIIEDGEKRMCEGATAISTWLDIPQVEAALITATHNSEANEQFYGKKLEFVTAHDVLEVLYRLRDFGTILSPIQQEEMQWATSGW